MDVESRGLDAGAKRPLREVGAPTYGSSPAPPAKTGGAPPPPKEVKLAGPLGGAKTVQLEPRLPFGLASPPGGWYGPFGFLRMVCYAFLGLAGVGTICFLVALFNLQASPALGALLLVAAALVSAAAAYAHEGLANEVTEVARQNGRYAALNETFRGQLKELGSTADKLLEWAEKGEDAYQRLHIVLGSLTRLSDLAQVNTIIRAFTDAEMRMVMFGEAERKNRRLSTLDELTTFFDGCSSVLEQHLPELDLKELKELGSRKGGGIGLTACSLIIAAVLANAHEDESENDRAEAILSLVLFILDPMPQARCDEAVRLLAPLLVGRPDFGTRELLEAELARMRRSVVAGGCRVPEEDCMGLAQAVADSGKTKTGAAA